MTPTPKAAALAAALTLAGISCRAQVPLSDAAFAGTLALVRGSAAAQVAAQKTAAAKAQAARLAAAGDEENPDGYGWDAKISVTDVPALLAARTAPDSSFTPGHLCSPGDPNFQEYRYAERIPYCRRKVTKDMKVQIARHYGVPESDWPDYEFDHLIPLAIGGDSSADNIWPQPHEPGSPDGSEGKDKLEEQLYLQMKAGTITQADAVRRIYGWFTAALMARKVLQIADR